jgi:hypothetical protein
MALIAREDLFPTNGTLIMGAYTLPLFNLLLPRGTQYVAKKDKYLTYTADSASISKDAV